MESTPRAAAPSAALRLGRRTYVVDRRFQYKYSLLLAGLGAALSVVFGALMYLAHRDALDTISNGAPLPPAVETASDTVLWLIAGTSVLLAVSLALFGILVTHRVAGPVYVMSHYVNVLARGRYPTLRPLRRGDELRDFFQHFQAAIASLREREQAEAEALEGLAARLDRVSDPEDRAALEELRAIAARKREATAPSAPSLVTGRQSAA